MYCKNCGTKIEKEEMFCKNCGTATKEEVKPTSESNKIETKKGDFRKIRAIYCFFVLNFVIYTLLALYYVISAISSSEVLLFVPTFLFVILDIIGIAVVLIFDTFQKSGRQLKISLIIFALIFSFVAGIIMLFVTKEDLTAYNNTK